MVNPNEKQPKTDEFSGTFERELVANTAVRVTGVYVRTVNTYALSEIDREGQYTIPITSLDPGPDGRLGTSDDTGRSITYYEYPVALRGNAFQAPWIVNDPASNKDYTSFEVAGVPSDHFIGLACASIGRIRPWPGWTLVLLSFWEVSQSHSTRPFWYE